MFDVYIKPIYEYGAAIWTTNVSKSAKLNIDRVFLKYLKRFLAVPIGSSNAITYYLTKTRPFSETLYENPTKPLQSINLSIPLHGHQLQLIKNKSEIILYTVHSEIPSDFHDSEVVKEFRGLPSNFQNRKKITNKIFDLKHRYLCTREDYHIYPNYQTCKCKVCSNPMEWHHPCFPS